VTYDDFLRSKVRLAQAEGLPCAPGTINVALKPHQAKMAEWLITGGRRALFASFGLGKTVIQLEAVSTIIAQVGGRGLIVCPLGVRAEFIADAKNILKWSVLPKFIRSIDEAAETGIYLTNYETVRDGKLDPRAFTAASLDEASILRGFGGSKTFREFMRLFTGDDGPKAGDGKRCRGTGTVPYRFVATATPSPNEYIELLAYADFLGIMDVSQAKTRFFKRDSTKADVLTLHPHKEEEFWLWVSSWALFVQRPSDLGFSDEGYELPPIDVRWHEVKTDHNNAGIEKSGQHKMFRDAAIGIQDAAAEKRLSLPARIEKTMELRAEDPGAHRILWHDLEREREAIEAAMPGVASVYGSQDLESREDMIAAFSRGEIQELATKPVLCGSGCNFQRHCSWAIFLGIGFKFNDFIQAIHRIQRFLQTKPVRIDLIYTEAEREVRKQLERKWNQHNRMVKNMTEIIRKFGLDHQSMAQTLTRKMGVERVEVSGKRFRLVNWDSVMETKRMEENSVGLVLTSIPFSTQYEYSPNYSDFGHSEGNKEFFDQMDFLTPELLRVLQPGRIAAIHVKDRVVPGGMTGLGYQTVYPFHARCIDHYTKHGFGYLGMKTIVTDVVRENNQTYRLGWTEQCKDGSKMGVGMPEYLLLFRKGPTSTEKSYADTPVVKQKKDYTRSRWQTDAHGFARSAGDRLLTPDELKALPHHAIFKLFRQHSLEAVYNFEEHVRIGETLEATGKLPSDFMLLQPQSWSPEVWTDITRMLTLNGAQNAKGKEMHLCPMQFDLADRVIEQMSMAGEIVFDPFSGLGTVPLRAMLKDRIGWGSELSPGYWADSVTYCHAAENELEMPSLFSLNSLQPANQEVA
jgi:DNA modification methylase